MQRLIARTSNLRMVLQYIPLSEFVSLQSNKEIKNVLYPNACFTNGGTTSISGAAFFIEQTGQYSSS
ncbi:hypothetical protein J2S09_000896 [Bacillus fengqiuensis]|nr:hypothetical protein [Bacillus fengqiuensis]